jgi:hypothetical protein
MPDKSKRGRGLLGSLPMQRRMGRSAPKSEQEKRDDSYAALGRAVTGIEGKPHSTKEGQKYAGARYLTRKWWGRGKKKKEGTEV